MCACVCNKCDTEMKFDQLVRNEFVGGISNVRYMRYRCCKNNIWNKIYVSSMKNKKREDVHFFGYLPLRNQYSTKSNNAELVEQSWETNVCKQVLVESISAHPSPHRIIIMWLHAHVYFTHHIALIKHESERQRLFILCAGLNAFFFFFNLSKSMCAFFLFVYLHLRPTNSIYFIFFLHKLCLIHLRKIYKNHQV